MRELLNLAHACGRSYFRGMKPISLFLAAAACSNLLLFSAFAQDSPARAAVEREAAEENYKLLSSAVNGLTTGQADLQRRLGALADEIRTLRAQDKKLIRDEFEELKKDLRKMLSAPSSVVTSASAKKNRSSTASEKGSEKLDEKPAERPAKPSEAAATNQEGVDYVIQPHNNLLAI